MDDSEQALNDFRDRVAAAQEALLAQCRDQPDRWWNADQLRDAARNGWPGEVMMFALTDLVNQGKLELDRELRVKAPS
jgi:hypothetical protein